MYTSSQFNNCFCMSSSYYQKDQNTTSNPNTPQTFTGKSQTSKPSQTIDIKPYTIPRHKPDIIWDNKSKKYIVPDYSENEVEVEERLKRERDLVRTRQEEEAKEEWKAEQERRRKMTLPLC